MSNLSPREQQALYRMIQQQPTQQARLTCLKIAIEHVMTRGKSPTLPRVTAPSGYECQPLTMRQFLEDPYYLGSIENLRPILKADLIALFDEGEYVEVAIDGSIGFGKSTFVSIAFAYMAYRLSCLTNPQRYVGLMPGSTIYLVNQSINLKLARKVVFHEIQARLRASPYFQREFRPQEGIETELRFPKDITILPVASEDTSAIGLNVFGACFLGGQKFVDGDGCLVSMRESIGRSLSVLTRAANGHIAKSSETRVIITGIKPFVHLVLDNGAELICTPDQKLREIDGNWVRASDAKGRTLRFVDLQAVWSADCDASAALAQCSQ